MIRKSHLVPAILAKPMTAGEIAAALNVHPQTAKVWVAQLVKVGEIEAVLPRARSGLPQTYVRAAVSSRGAIGGNAFTNVRPKGRG